MKNIVISVDALHDMQFEEDYTEYIRGWNEAIDKVLTNGHKDDGRDRWHAVAIEGNPKEEGLYITTKRLSCGNNKFKYEVSMDRWSRDGYGKEWANNSNRLVIAWRPLPEPYTEKES